MILYKYLPPERVDVLANTMVRFTQPGDLNDLFDSSPHVREIFSVEDAEQHVREHFDEVVRAQTNEELNKVLSKSPSYLHKRIRKLFERGVKKFSPSAKAIAPRFMKALEVHVLDSVTSSLNKAINNSMGILSLSETPDSVLMWSHYAKSSTGYAVGFDSEHPFFNQRRTTVDDFGFLRKVEYGERPSISVGSTNSTECFLTKADHWSYEKEWRMMMPLESASKVEARDQFPLHLFSFPPDAVREIILGARIVDRLKTEIAGLAAKFANACLLRISNDGPNYSLRVTKCE